MLIESWICFLWWTIEFSKRNHFFHGFQGKPNFLTKKSKILEQKFEKSTLIISESTKERVFRKAKEDRIYSISPLCSSSRCHSVKKILTYHSSLTLSLWVSYFRWKNSIQVVIRTTQMYQTGRKNYLQLIYCQTGLYNCFLSTG